MQQLKTTDEILVTSEGLLLYKKLVLQLNKDFQRANIDVDFSEEIAPSELKIKLKETVFNLLQNNHSNFQNLLYTVDVSEVKIKQIEAENTFDISEEITFLILLREWQKVWFKDAFSK